MLLGQKNNNTQLDKLYFWSDPHFGHKNVLSYCDRPWPTVEDQTEALIERYNETVPPDGICIWVGDCFFMSKSKAKAIMDRLNGTKILVRGNHDQKYAHMYSLGFTHVCDYMEMHIAGYSVRIKHYPPKWISGKIKNFLKFNIWNKLAPRRFRYHKPRYYDRYPEQNGKWTIHGHTHAKLKLDVLNKAIHVGVDAWDYKPASFRTIEKIIQRAEAKSSYYTNR